MVRSSFQNRNRSWTEIRASFSINPSPFLMDFGPILESKKLSKTASERSQKDSRFRCRFWADLEPIWQKQFSRIVWPADRAWSVEFEEFVEFEKNLPKVQHSCTPSGAPDSIRSRALRRAWIKDLRFQVWGPNEVQVKVKLKV